MSHGRLLAWVLSAVPVLAGYGLLSSAYAAPAARPDPPDPRVAAPTKTSVPVPCHPFAQCWQDQLVSPDGRIRLRLDCIREGLDQFCDVVFPNGTRLSRAAIWDWSPDSRYAVNCYGLTHDNPCSGYGVVNMTDGTLGDGFSSSSWHAWAPADHTLAYVEVSHYVNEPPYRLVMVDAATGERRYPLTCPGWLLDSLRGKIQSISLQAVCGTGDRGEAYDMTVYSPDGRITVPARCVRSICAARFPNGDTLDVSVPPWWSPDKRFAVVCFNELNVAKPCGYLLYGRPYTRLSRFEVWDMASGAQLDLDLPAGGPWLHWAPGAHTLQYQPSAASPHLISVDVVTRVQTRVTSCPEWGSRLYGPPNPLAELCPWGK